MKELMNIPIIDFFTSNKSLNMYYTYNKLKKKKYASYFFLLYNIKIFITD